MCPIIANESFEKCDHTIAVDTGKTSPFCLFGTHCREVGFAATVIRRFPEKQCPYCAGTADQKKGLLEEPRRAPRVPLYLRDKDRCVAGALAETKRILSCDAAADLTDRNCKALLQYILDLPAWMKKGQLVAAFGTGVSGYYGKAWEKEMLGLARRRHFDNSLNAGLTQKRDEVKEKADSSTEEE